MIGQPFRVDLTLEMFGRVFGGATAFPKAGGQLSCIATRRQPTSKMAATARRVFAGSWVARHDRLFRKIAPKLLAVRFQAHCRSYPN
jgi:hypothetical protein